MNLTSTQIGAIGENLLVNAVMKESNGRLSPFIPVADDDGLDLLFYDKVTGNSIALQLKCRTVTLKKNKSEERGNQVHFQIRNATFHPTRNSFFVLALFNADLTNFECTWLVPLDIIYKEGTKKGDRIGIRTSKSQYSKDKYSSYKNASIKHLAERIIMECERKGTIII